MIAALVFISLVLGLNNFSNAGKFRCFSGGEITSFIASER